MNKNEYAQVTFNGMQALKQLVYQEETGTVYFIFKNKAGYSFSFQLGDKKYAPQMKKIMESFKVN